MAPLLKLSNGQKVRKNSEIISSLRFISPALPHSLPHRADDPHVFPRGAGSRRSSDGSPYDGRDGGADGVGTPCDAGEHGAGSAFFDAVWELAHTCGSGRSGCIVSDT